MAVGWVGPELGNASRRSEGPTATGPEPCGRWDRPHRLKELVARFLLARAGEGPVAV